MLIFEKKWNIAFNFVKAGKTRLNVILSILLNMESFYWSIQLTSGRARTKTTSITAMIKVHIISFISKVFLVYSE